MAHHGYIPHIINYFSFLDNIRVLEIGVDRGCTTFPLIHHLITLGKRFTYNAIDIFIKEEVKIVVNYVLMGSDVNTQKVNLIQQNSLEFLQSNFEKYNVILIDGDHNYYTVSKELELLTSNNVYDNSLIIVDDYNGRWSEKDLFYSTRPEYNVNNNASEIVETEKHGVKAAVDDFCESHKDWTTISLMNGEPIILLKKEFAK